MTGVECQISQCCSITKVLRTAIGRGARGTGQALRCLTSVLDAVMNPLVVPVGGIGM